MGKEERPCPKQFDTQYFMIKPPSVKTIDMSFYSNKWTFQTKKIENNLTRAHRMGCVLYC
jgi:hypothetical protein